MKAERVANRTIFELFDRPVQFEIPFFQRGYAWQKRQWDDMFTDIQEQVIADFESGEPLDQIEHFFGPIVVQAKDSQDEDGIPHYQVVDGQQRITTVYMLLGLIMYKLAGLQHQSPNAQSHVRELRKLLVNEITPGDDYRRMKVFSTKGDRLPTYRIIFGDEQAPKSPFYDTDIRLYRPGLSRVDEFKAYCAKRLKYDFKDAESLWLLAQSLLRCLKIVWIPLEAQDNAQAIFESLNDKGMPLSASELLCSFLFRPLRASGDFEQLHNDYWLDAIQMLGTREVFEEYLRYFLSIGEKKMVGKGRKIYIHFKNRNKNLSSPKARQLLIELHEGVTFYRWIRYYDDYRHRDTQIWKLLESIDHTRMDSCTPFLIDVLRAHKHGLLSEEDCRALLRETLVLLVRRKMTERPTTAYDVFFPNLYGRIAQEPDKARAIHDEFKKSDLWISNQEFEDALVKRTLYRSRDLAFTRMVLMEIDKKMHPFNQLPDYSTLETIEHIIPQDLDKAWKEYLGPDATDEQFSTAIHSIGNLCLVSGAANSSLGRDPFEAKQNSISGITALAQQIKNHAEDWNLHAVRQRSAELAKTALTVWNWA